MFDKYLRDIMILDVKAAEPQNKWESFQTKFFLTDALYNFKHFFEKILYNVTRAYLREMCTIIEYKHIFGMVFDDQGNMISLEEELGIFKRVEDEL